MALTLRDKTFWTLSLKPLASKKAITTRKCKFFDVLAHSTSTKLLRSISTDTKILESCGRKWKKQYKNIGSFAKRKTRLMSAILKHKSCVLKAACKMLVSPS
jgi:hypothetical protein